MMTKIVKNIILGLFFGLPFSLVAQASIVGALIQPQKMKTSQLAAQNAALVGDWKTQIPDDTGKLFPIKLTMKSDGSFTVDFGVDGTEDIAGKYTREGEQITIVESKGTCPDKKGIYKIAVTATTFNMNRVSDEGENRGGPEGKMVFTKM